MLRKYSLFALLLSTSLLHGQTATSAQTWFTITPESSTTALVLPVGATYRFGDYTNNRWSAPITVTAPTTLSPVFFPSGVFPFADPDPGVVKELDVLETTSAQAVTVTNLGVNPAAIASLTVPAIIPPNSVPVPPGTSYTVTFSNFATTPTTSQNALMLAFANQPPSGANQSWVGTQMNLTIDGVTLVCTYGQTYTSGVFTLNCTVPVQVASSTP